jgi:hypothetical protein
MARLNLVGPYLKAVARHWVWLVVAAVGAVGNGATLFGDFVVPRWIWWGVFALGVLVAQFLAYADVADDLAATKARLRELDSDEAKRSYLDEQVARAESLKRRTEATAEDQWVLLRRTYNADVVHWESGVRADLRESFEGDVDILFDSDEGLPFPEDAVVGNRADLTGYLERRIRRLRQIKENL